MRTSTPIKLIFVFLLALSFSLTSFAQTRINTANEAAFERSIDKIVAEIPQAEAEEFSAALISIIFITAFSNLDASEAEMEAKIKNKLNGKTAAQVIAQGRQIQEEMDLDLDDLGVDFEELLEGMFD